MLLVKPKDCISESETTGVVYQVPCASCPSTHVGKTGSPLNQRLCKHQRAIESGDCANSTLAMHSWGHHYPVDWYNSKCLDHHRDIHQRLVLESIHIRSQPKPLNGTIRSSINAPGLQFIILARLFYNPLPFPCMF